MNFKRFFGIELVVQRAKHFQETLNHTIHIYTNRSVGMQVADARLRNISVVVVADTYHPDMIYKNLVNGGIMPDRSEIVQSSQVPGECDVKYRGGIHIAVNKQRFIIGNDYNELFKEYMNDEVYALAAEFVKTYSDVPYRAIGLNCTISLQHDDPLRWMTQKFLKTNTPSENTLMAPRFLIKTDDAELTLAFIPVEVMDQGQLKPFVVIECNHHHGGPFTADNDILRIVTGWRDTKDIILSRLGEWLELG